MIFRSLLLLSLLFTGCSSTPEKSENETEREFQSLSFNLSKEPSSLDPAFALDPKSTFLIRMLSEGLTRLSPEGEPLLALAKSVKPSSDGYTYIFKLREATWSNGKPLVSDDFLYSWQRTLTSKGSLANPEELFILKNGQAVREETLPPEDLGVYAPDRSTLIVTLEHPADYFLEAVANPSFFPLPRRAVEENPLWAKEAKSYLSLGPFLIESWEHHEKIHLVKNPNYWDATSVLLKSITLLMVEDPELELNLFRSGELDWAGAPFRTLPTEALAKLKESGELQQHPLAATYLYIFNTESSPLNNQTMRHALNVAIDRDEIVDQVLSNGEQIAMGLLPPQMKEMPKAYYADHDINRARRLFRQALRETGMLRGELPVFVISTSHEPEDKKIAKAIASHWKEALNIKVKVVEEGKEELAKKIRDGNFMITPIKQVAIVRDKSDLLRRFGAENLAQNPSRWVNPEYTDMLSDARALPRRDAKLRLFDRSEDLLMEHMPSAPIFHPTTNYLKEPSLKNVVLTETLYLDFKWAYKEG